MMFNVGSLDRAVRFALGVMLIAAPFVQPTADYFVAWGLWKYAVVTVGFLSFGTALFRFCPAYTLFGVSTCGIKKP